VAPVSRLSIMLGRTFGGITTAFLQSLLLIIFALFIGFHIVSIAGLFVAFGFMLLIGLVFISIGLILASVMTDMQGFGLILNLLIFPIFFLSGAIYPVSALPGFIRYVTYANPLTYGVDGMRGALLGVSVFPVWMDAAILGAIAIAMLALGAYSFSKAKAVA
jgi:ABC-2 type transport system permease protein